MKAMYLAGAIHGCTDEQARGWRERVKRSLAGEYEFLDPMRRDYRGVEDENAMQIVEDDLNDIARASVVLVNAERPSWGTAMEAWWAGNRGLHRVYVVCPGPVSPWLRFVAHKVFPTMEEAIEFLRTPHARLGAA